MGKLVVVGAVGLASFFVFSGQVPVEFIKGYVPETHYYFVPVFLITIGTYFVACAFFSVYEMAVDTLFICFRKSLLMIPLF
jgi:choline transporter-like protein 2/4/5